MPTLAQKDQQQSKSKRPAKRQASPALSNSAAKRVKAQYLSSVRIKREPGLSPQPTAPSPLVDDVSKSATQVAPSKRTSRQNGSPFQPTKQNGDPAPNNAEPAVPHDGTALWTQVLSQCTVNSKVFDGAVEEIIRQAFVSRTQEPAAPPGTTHITKVLERLRHARVEPAKLETATAVLWTAWRSQMATWLGSSIGDAASLQRVIETLSSAVDPAATSRLSTSWPPQPDRLVDTATYAQNIVATTRNDEWVHQQSRQPVLSVGDAVSSHRVVEKHLSKPETSSQYTHPPESQPASTASNADTLNSVAALLPVPELFEDKFHVFRCFVEEARHKAFGQIWTNDHHKELVQQEIKQVWDGLEKSQRKDWFRLHKRLSKGKATKAGSATGEDLLASQGLLKAFHLQELGPSPGRAKTDQTSLGNLPSRAQPANQLARSSPLADSERRQQDPTDSGYSTSSQSDNNSRPERAAVGGPHQYKIHTPKPAGSVEREVKRQNAALLCSPITVPFFQTNDPRTHCLLLLGTPDQPFGGMSALDLDHACRKALEPGGGFLGVRPRSKTAWTARFISPKHASRARDKTIRLRDGYLVRPEYLHTIPPRAFICDASNVPRLHEKEAVVRIAAMFSSSKRDMTIKVQHTDDPSAGRQFLVTFQRPPELFRFYIPMAVGPSKDLWFACFRPKSVVDPCLLCHAMHPHKDCSFARELAVPANA